MGRWFTLRARKRIRRTIIYLLFLAVCLEIGARVILSSELMEGLVQGNYDYSRRQKWINSRRNIPRDTQAVRTFDVYDPQRGWRLKNNVRQMQVWSGKILNSNSKGLRGTKEYSYKRVPNKVRIAVLGDSFTFGEEISDHETYSVLLERSIPDSEVLNFGTRGYGHDQMLMYFRSEVRRYQPDIVMLGFVFENMQRNLLSFRDYAKPRFEIVGNQLVARNLPVPPPEYFLRSEWRRSKLFDLFAIIRETQSWKSADGTMQTIRMTEAILTVLVQEISRIDAKAVFVFLPVAHLIGDTGPRPTFLEQCMLEFCTRHEHVAGFSLQPRFDAEFNAGFKLNRVSHWNAHAHAVAAAEIKGFLEQQGLIPGKQ